MKPQRRKWIAWACGAGLLLPPVFWLMPRDEAGTSLRDHPVDRGEKSPRTAAGPLPQEIYIWQREWHSGVREALAAAPEGVKTWLVLGAEIEWKKDGPVTRWPAIDREALKASGRSVGVVLRIGPHPGPYDPREPHSRLVAAAAARLVVEMETAGIPCAELQIDFDCAQKKLAGYRQWLRAIKERTRGIPLTFTALPSWLDEPEFRALAAEASGFVLQAHMIEKPRSGAPPVLCDPIKTRLWVEQAAEAGGGTPFRVALPTYTSLVAFSPEGKTLGVLSDGSPPEWPADTRLTEYAADPAAMAGLVAAWRTQRPENLLGIVWFRMPVAGETRNWRWPALTGVMAGRVPKADLRVRWTAGNPADFSLANSGAGTADMPQSVKITWTGAAAEAADGLNGWTVNLLEDGAVFVHVKKDRLPSGETRPLGWIRVSSPATFHAEILR